MIKKNNKVNIFIVIGVIAFLLLVGIFFFYDRKTNVRGNKIDAKPSNNSTNNSSSNSNYIKGCPQHKTWDEMTSKERKACQEYFEDQFESGEWSLD